MMPKRKNYYRPQAQMKKGKFNITPGLKGFICSSNTYREKECVRESFNILNEFYSKLFGDEKLSEEVPQDTTEEVEDELAKEIEELKAAKFNPEQHKFHVVNTDVKGVVFIKTAIDDPVKLAHSILTEISETKQQRARFLLRMIPVEVVCRATIEEIKAAAVPLFKKYFKCDPTTFAVVFNRRQNDSVDRMELVRELALLVTDCNPLHQANLKEPNLAVIVEVMRGICCLSVVPDYYKLRKYNLLELTNPTEQAKGDSGKTTEDKPEEDAGDKVSVKDTVGESSTELGEKEVSLDTKADAVTTSENSES